MKAANVDLIKNGEISLSSTRLGQRTAHDSKGYPAGYIHYGVRTAPLTGAKAVPAPSVRPGP